MYDSNAIRGAFLPIIAPALTQVFGPQWLQLRTNVLLMQGAVQAPLRTSPVEQQPVAQNCSDTNAVHLIGLDMHAIIELFVGK
jgi:hypothetical protein